MPRPHLKKTRCIPPKHSAEFVYHMEGVLAAYHRPPGPAFPVVRMDETFKQLVGQTRGPPPMRPGDDERFDHVYTRDGVASLFPAFERSGNGRLPRDPLAGWRTVLVTDRRRRPEWASFVRPPLDGRYRGATKVVLVTDQLNTHSAAGLYEAFAPAEAERLADRLEVRHTPEHGSWLDMAEVEPSALGRQCLARRIANRSTLTDQVAAWVAARNAAQTKVDWQFATADARVKLRRLYPSYEG